MNLAWEKMEGLVPVTVQHADTLQVLMLAYMNPQALEQTQSTKRVTFFSRSKNRLWTKGETSGHYLALVSVQPDCDGDALLVMARPVGPTCHRQTVSCFGEVTAPGIGFLSRLEEVLADRFQKMPEGSYTTKLIRAGLDRMAQKVGEEGVEVVIAAKNEDGNSFKGEAADLIFHLMVLLRAKGIAMNDVVETLRSRHK